MFLTIIILPGGKRCRRCIAVQYLRTYNDTFPAPYEFMYTYGHRKEYYGI